MLEKFKWLLKNEEIEFEKKKFRGKLAAKAYKYSNHLDGVIRTRLLIFFMSIIVLYRVLTNYLIQDFLDIQFLIERGVFSIVLLLCGLAFNKARIICIVISAIPLTLITGTYLFTPGQFNIKIIAFMGAVLILILLGIYNHIQSKRLKSELEKTMLENSLIES